MILININTKTIGDINEAICMTELLKRNISISIPWGDNQSYDMIMDYQNKLYKIQCKTSRCVIENETFMIPTESYHTNTTTKYTHSYQGKIDFFITQYKEKVYLIPIEKTHKSAFQLRLVPTKNNQVIGINFAEEYELDKQLLLL